MATYEERYESRDRDPRRSAEPERTRFRDDTRVAFGERDRGRRSEQSTPPAERERNAGSEQRSDSRSRGGRRSDDAD
eukprot:7375874-Prymnesium_polylepis.1